MVLQRMINAHHLLFISVVPSNHSALHPVIVCNWNVAHILWVIPPCNRITGKTLWFLPWLKLGYCWCIMLGCTMQLDRLMLHRHCTLAGDSMSQHVHNRFIFVLNSRKLTSYCQIHKSISIDPSRYVCGKLCAKYQPPAYPWCNDKAVLTSNGARQHMIWVWCDAVPSIRSGLDRRAGSGCNNYN